MGHRRKRELGPHQHAEGLHGEKTHRRFIEQLHEGERRAKRTEGAPVESHHRDGEEREQHDEAER